MSSHPAVPSATIHPYAWVAFFATYLASIVCSFAFLAVPPLIPQIISTYNVDLSSAGLTMAVFSFVGLVLSLPAGWVLKKYGIKSVGIIAMIVTLAGCALCAAAATFPVYLLGRGLQGIGFTFIAIVGMTTAGLWFPPQKVSLAMGLAGTCVAVGGFLAMATVPHIVASAGVSAVWWMCAALSAISALVVATLLKMPPWILAAHAAGAAGAEPNTSEGFTNRNIWLMTLAYTLTFIPAGAMMTFYVTFLTKVRGMTLESAGPNSGLIMIGWLVGAPLGGAILAKFGRFKLAMILAAIGTFILTGTGFIATGPAIPIWAFMLGVVSMGYAQVVGMSAVPGIMKKPELIGVGIGIYMLGVNAAGIIGPPMLGAIVQHVGWVSSGYVMLPFLVVSIIVAAVTKFAD
jgi:MFS family permease